MIQPQTTELYKQAARQLLDEADYSSEWHIQFSGPEAEPEFVVDGLDGEISQYYTTLEFVQGSIFAFLDPALPEVVINQQLSALAHAVRAEFETQEMRNQLTAVNDNLADLPRLTGLLQELSDG